MVSLKNLTQQDIEILKKWGHQDKDLSQINKAITKTDYRYCHNGKEEKITHKQARELLGNEQFLSGISRSAFHYSSCREIEGKGYVDFDSRRMFKEFEKEAQLEDEIIRVFEKEYRSDNSYDGMLPANSIQLEKYSIKKLNELCDYGILQKRACDGLAYEFNSQYLNDVVIPKIQAEKLQGLKTVIECYKNKYIDSIEIEDVDLPENEKGWRININTPLWENFSFNIVHNGYSHNAVEDIKCYVDEDYDIYKEDYISTFEKCENDCSGKSSTLNVVVQETEMLKSILKDLSQRCSEYDNAKATNNEQAKTMNEMDITAEMF